MKLYLSGSITNNKDYKDQFKITEQMLVEVGYEIVNPVTLPHKDTDNWEECMKLDIAEMMKCDGVVLLPGWTKSKGARIEKELADNLGIKALFLYDWLYTEKGVKM